MTLSKNRTDLIKQISAYSLPVLVFLLALMPRALSLGTFLTQDEPLWINRSVQFYQALAHFDWAGTYAVPSPGVTTMWLSGAALDLYRICGSAGLLSMDFGGYLAAGSLPIAVITSAGIALIFLLLKRLFGIRVAVLGAVFIALDPFYIAYSRVIHMDALLATFMALSVLALLVYLRERRRLMLAASGAFMGLAILTKITALFLVPFGILVILFWLLADARFNLKKPFETRKLFPTITIASMLLLICMLTIIIVWPAAWAHPTFVAKELFLNSKNVTTKSISIFTIPWLENAATFYPMAIFEKITPVALIFSITCLFLLGLDLKKGNAGPVQKNMLVLALFIILFTLLLSISSKKSGRYSLPIFPFIDTLAAIGLCRLAAFGEKRLPDKREILKKGFYTAIVALLLIVQLVPLVSLQPYYISYYNPMIIGGPSSYPELFVMDWGEGMSLAARYLNQKPDAGDLVVAAQYTGFKEFFVGKTVNMSSMNDSDYVVFYPRPMPKNIIKNTSDLYKNSTPEKVISINGIDYCWIYKTKKFDNDYLLSDRNMTSTGPPE